MFQRLGQLQWVDAILGVGLILMAIGIGMNVKDKLASPTVQLVKAGVTPTIVVQGDNKVTFDIGGEVLNPGVYKLVKGSRIGEALAAANGLSANADREWVEKNINRAQVIADGIKIYIPKKSTNINLQTSNENKSASVLGETTTNNGVIDINTAGVKELDKLTGIGPALAQRIIDYREKNGGFKDVNEIKMVSGIGDKLFEKIKDEMGI